MTGITGGPVTSVTRDTFDRLLDGWGSLVGEVAGVVPASGLMLWEDLDADELFKGLTYANPGEQGCRLALPRLVARRRVRTAHTSARTGGTDRENR